jgi:hypothetical protein
MRVWANGLNPVPARATTSLLTLLVTTLLTSRMEEPDSKRHTPTAPLRPRLRLAQPIDVGKTPAFATGKAQLPTDESIFARKMIDDLEMLEG